MSENAINIEQVIACLESELEYVFLKYDYAVGQQDTYYYMGLKKGIEVALSTIKSQMP